MGKLSQLWRRITRTTKQDHEAHVIMMGWLQKKGEVVNSWKRRYFTLTETELKYFSTEDTRYALGVIQISAIFSVRSGKSAGAAGFSIDKSRDPEKVLVLVDTHRTYYLEADSSVLAYEWIQTISELMLRQQAVSD